MFHKKCPNPLCQEHFSTKNSKKKFCNLHCKNQAAYLYKQEVYEWELRLLKARLRNIKILEHLMSLKIPKVNKSELSKMGFNFSAAIIPDKNDQEQPVYRFGNIYLVVIAKTEFEIINVKSKK